MTTDFHDGAMNRTSILAELRQEGRSVDVSYSFCLPKSFFIRSGENANRFLQTPDLTYNYVENIPYISFLGKSDKFEAVGDRIRNTKTVAKRKAEGQADEQPDSKKPRHTGGLLASEQQPDGVPESNAASPGAIEEQETRVVLHKDLPDLPNGASEVDEYGVRSVNRRAKSPANRFIVPPMFSFADEQIGFRDSTNDSTRKATRATRGRFLDTPNSSTWHLDHTVKDYDCREYKDDTLDPSTVKKYGLHPKYGFFLPSSQNEAEFPDERVDGTRPIVLAPNQHTPVHASRSARDKKMDLALQEDATKGLMAKMIGNYCVYEDIEPEEVISKEMRDRERQAIERLALPSNGGEGPTEQAETDPSNLDKDCIALLLQAAEYLESEKPTSQFIASRPSRPYDAVRDVFTGAEPAPPLPEQRLPEATTNPLDILADMALGLEARGHPEQNEALTSGGSSKIGQRLISPPNQPPPPPSTFLQTALNPPPTFAHIAPAPTPMMEIVQQNHLPKNPFVSQDNGDSLPPLRPNRLEEGQNTSQLQRPLPRPAHRPQEFGSPRGPLRSNSGAFYPPAPPRAYHHGLTFHEQSMMSVPVQQMQPMSGPGLMATQTALAPHTLSRHPIMSPPHQIQPHLAPVPTQMETPLSSISPPSPLINFPSPAHGLRHRPEVTSNSNDGKNYRRIAAAPLPHNRPWTTNGGTELRLAHYDHKEAIKDYMASEPPPHSGPTVIRGWNNKSVSNPKGRNRTSKKGDSEEKDSPK